MGILDDIQKNSLLEKIRATYPRAESQPVELSAVPAADPARPFDFGPATSVRIVAVAGGPMPMDPDGRCLPGIDAQVQVGAAPYAPDGLVILSVVVDEILAREELREADPAAFSRLPPLPPLDDAQRAVVSRLFDDYWARQEDESNTTPAACAKCGSLDLWENIAGAWSCQHCDDAALGKSRQQLAQATLLRLLSANSAAVKDEEEKPAQRKTRKPRGNGVHIHEWEKIVVGPGDSYFAPCVCGQEATAEDIKNGLFLSGDYKLVGIDQRPRYHQAQPDAEPQAIEPAAECTITPLAGRLDGLGGNITESRRN